MLGAVIYTSALTQFRYPSAPVTELAQVLKAGRAPSSQSCKLLFTLILRLGCAATPEHQLGNLSALPEPSTFAEFKPCHRSLPLKDYECFIQITECNAAAKFDPTLTYLHCEEQLVEIKINANIIPHIWPRCAPSSGKPLPPSLRKRFGFLLLLLNKKILFELITLLCASPMNCNYLLFTDRTLKLSVACLPMFVIFASKMLESIHFLKIKCPKTVLNLFL